MDITEAWALIDEALTTGLMAAHGAGLIDRHKVGHVNAAQKAVADYINDLKKSNDGFVEHFNAEAEKKPCDCEEKKDE